MAIVELNHEENTNNLDDYLRYCQIIADAFTKALDQNECNIKVVVGIAQELTDQKDEVEDLWDLMKPDVYIPPAAGDADVYVPTDEEVYTVVDSSVSPFVNNTNAIKRKMKESCYDCDYNWPTIDFNENFNWSFSKLKASLEIYTSKFNQITNPNFCHVSAAFNYACLQDLLKLIALLLSAYSTILALRKLSSISLSAFIKGVVSGLLGQLLGNISLQMDLSKTGLSCILKVFEEIASNIPDGSNLNAMLPEDFLEALTESLENAESNTVKNTVKTPIYQEFKDANGNITQVVVGYEDVPNPSTVSTTGLNEYNDDGTLKVTATDEDRTTYSPENAYLKAAMENLANPAGQNFLKKFTNDLKKDSEEYEEYVSGAFGYVNDTIKQATDDFNGTLSQLFGLLDFFQCEAARTGTDFIDLLEYMQKLINVINLLSAIVSIIAKKQVQKLCKTKESLSNFSDYINNEVVLEGSHDLDPVEVIEEFLGKVVEETKDENDEIIPIIYDKDKETLLPKLNLTSCNLKEFIEAHNIDNIIEKAVEQVQKEAEQDRERLYDEYTNTSDTSKFPHVSLPTDNVINKNNWKVYPIQFVRPDFTKPEWLDKNPEDLYTNSSLNTNTDYGLQSILDFVYNNPLDRITDNSETPTIKNTDTTSSNTTDDKSYRDKINTPSYSPTGKDKKSFENECRSIDDVLSMLGNLQGK